MPIIVINLYVTFHQVAFFTSGNIFISYIKITLFLLLVIYGHLSAK